MGTSVPGWEENKLPIYFLQVGFVYFLQFIFLEIAFYKFLPILKYFSINFHELSDTFFNILLK